MHIMPKTCSLVYLDTNGKQSVDYYGNLHLGHETAKKIYLEKMAKHAFSKLQKVDLTPDEFLALSRKINSPTDGGKNVYTSSNSVEFERVTGFLEQLQNPFNLEETAVQVTINNRAKELIFNEPKKYGLTAATVKRNDFKLK